MVWKKQAIAVEELPRYQQGRHGSQQHTRQ
jgi:hypothetical protein